MDGTQADAAFPALRDPRRCNNNNKEQLDRQRTCCLLLVASLTLSNEAAGPVRACYF